jgi:hypothetical protein
MCVQLLPAETCATFQQDLWLTKKRKYGLQWDMITLGHRDA